MHPKCLECPRSTCRYDYSKTLRVIDLRIPIRDGGIRRQRALGASIQQLADEFGLSKRTIFRVTSELPAKVAEGE